MLRNGPYSRSLCRRLLHCKALKCRHSCEPNVSVLWYRYGRGSGIALSRGVKTQSTVELRGLTFDRTDHEAGLPKIEDGLAYPTVVQQAHNNMRKYVDCVLLTRVGSFYELYFEQADKYGPLLNLKVARKKTAAGPVAMVQPALLY